MDTASPGRTVPHIDDCINEACPWSGEPARADSLRAVGSPRKARRLRLSVAVQEETPQRVDTHTWETRN